MFLLYEERTCRKRLFQEEADSNKQKEAEDKSSKVSASGNYVSSESCDEESEVHLEIALASSNVLNNSDSNWCIDSGASQQMSPAEKEMTDFVRFKSPLDVKLADISVLHAYRKETVHLSVFDGLEKINVTKMFCRYLKYIH